MLTCEQLPSHKSSRKPFFFEERKKISEIYLNLEKFQSVLIYKQPIKSLDSIFRGGALLPLGNTDKHEKERGSNAGP